MRATGPPCCIASVASEMSKTCSSLRVIRDSNSFHDADSSRHLAWYSATAFRCSSTDIPLELNTRRAILRSRALVLIAPPQGEGRIGILHPVCEMFSGVQSHRINSWFALGDLSGLKRLDHRADNPRATRQSRRTASSANRRCAAPHRIPLSHL